MFLTKLALISALLFNSLLAPITPTTAITQTTINTQDRNGDILRPDYRLLATTKTSTLEREMNEAAEEGFRFDGVSGGDTAFGGNEVVVIMSSNPVNRGKANYHYKLLATNKTSKMQKELLEAGNAGYDYRGQTISDTTFGGREVILILEQDRNQPLDKYEYKLLATSKTSTMQKELKEAGKAGYIYAGITVAETAFGGKEVVVITRKKRSER